MQGQNPINSINEYDFSVLDEIQPKDFNLSEVLRDVLFYSLPLFSFIFFMLIFFSAVLPGIDSINTKLTEIESLESQVTTLEERIVNIQKLGESNAEIQDTIEKINSIVPTGQTEVVKFGDRISETVALHSLLNNILKTGELVVVTNETDGLEETNLEQDSSVLPLSQIPTKFDLRGSFEDIRQFFITLYQGQDFFVVEKMELNSSESEEWYGEISLVKYQFSPSTNFDPVKAYFSISENSKINPQVLTFLEKKFIDNAFEGSVTDENTIIDDTNIVD